MCRVPIDERIAIKELTSLYAVYCDGHQFEKLAELFTEDCVYDETCSGVARVTDQGQCPGNMLRERRGDA